VRILYIASCRCYSADGYACAHGAEGRELGLAWGLLNHGADVDLVSESTGKTKQGLVRVKWPETLSGYDAIVCCGIGSHQWMLLKPNLLEEAKAHPCVYIQLDALYGNDHEQMGYATGFGISSPMATALCRQYHPEQDAFLMRWGFPEVPTGTTSPWPEGEHLPRVFFAGIVHPRVGPALNRLADLSNGLYEVWIAGLFNESGRWGGCSDEYRAEHCHPLLHFMTDVMGTIFDRKHGPLPYGPPIWRCASHADLGISWSYGLRSSISAKLYDYLACGCPSVSEDGSPNNGDIITLRAGRVSPMNDTDAMHQAIVDELKVKRPPEERTRIRTEALALGTWTDSAGLLLSHMRRKS